MPQVLNNYGDRIEEPVELTDLVPTIHDLLELSSPKDIDGESMEPMMLGGVKRSAPARSICFDREANIAGREADSSRIRHGAWCPSDKTTIALYGEKQKTMHRSCTF